LLLIFLGIIPVVNSYMSIGIQWIDVGYLYAQHVVFYCFLVLPLKYVKNRAEQVPTRKSMDVNSSQVSSSQKFDEFLEDDENLMAFREFLLQQHCVENLVFFMQVKHFKELPDEKLFEEAQLIIDRFIMPYSDIEVNLPSNASTGLRQRLNEHGQLRDPQVVSRDMFDEAQKVIFLLMEYDSYRVYKRAGHSRAVSMPTQVTPVDK
jgi:hypothetical protein